jgi:hypothetical protein
MATVLHRTYCFNLPTAESRLTGFLSGKLLLAFASRVILASDPVGYMTIFYCPETDVGFCSRIMHECFYAKSKEVKMNIIRILVTIDGFWIDERIYWTL